MATSDAEVCRICLATDVKMHSVQHGALKTCMNFIVEYWNNYPTKGLPSCICYLCAAYLKKSYNFIQTSQSAHNLLMDIFTQNGMISKSIIKDHSNLRTKCPVISLQTHIVDEAAIINFKYDDENQSSCRIFSQDDVTKEEIQGSMKAIVQSTIKEEIDYDYKPEASLILDTKTIDSDFDSEDEKALVMANEGKKVDVFILEQRKKEPPKTRKKSEKKKERVIQKSKRKEHGRSGPRKDLHDLSPDEITLQEHFNIVRLTLEEQIVEWNLINQRRSQGKNFTCDICTKAYTQQAAFQTHVHGHHRSRGSVSCPVCKLRYKSEVLVRSHLKFSHSRKYHCKSCLKTFNTQCMAKRHHKWHSGQVYRCNQCAFSTQHEALLCKHVRRRHPTKHACAICGHGFTSAAGLRLHGAKAHLEGHLDAEPDEQYLYKCEECDLSFRSEDARRVHLMTSFQHNKTRHMYEPSPEDPVSRRTCKSCGVVCATLPALACHVNEAHPKTETIVGYPLDCEHCGTSLKTRKEHWSHIRLRHPTKRASYQPLVAAVCQTCGKGFTNTTKLQLHELRHSKPTVRCEVCNKLFYDKFRLNEHMSIHRETVPHRCNTCGRGFKAQSNLTRHYKTHTDIASYECKLCSKMFKYSTSLNLHIRSVHYKIPPPPRKKRSRAKTAANSGSSVDL